ncbi:methyltransferase [Qipengyuania sp. DGS5-3]|uniref:methyltransferase n=1 Tax=Qipengyuania sp. DGS5-3 TaxID=3349632 RepID=UPI0036D2F54A
MITRSKKPDAASYLLRDAQDDVVERMDFMRLTPRRALIVGDWTGLLPSVLKDRGAQVDCFPIGVFEEEHPIEGAPYDLIIHLLGLATVNDLPGALIHSRNALSEDGLMIASFPGAGSLPRLRQAMLAADGEKPAARIHPMVDSGSGAGLAKRAGFTKQVVDSHTLSVRFSSLERLISDLRDQGMNNALMNSAPHICREGFARAKDAFQTLAEPDGKVSETFEMVTITGWK